MAEVDRSSIRADGKDLSFITIKVVDGGGLVVPTASDEIEFSIEWAGEIEATDNGDPTNMTEFPSHRRKSFNGLALVIVKSKDSIPGVIRLRADAEGLEGVSVALESGP